MPVNCHIPYTSVDQNLDPNSSTNDPRVLIKDQDTFPGYLLKLDSQAPDARRKRKRHAGSSHAAAPHANQQQPGSEQVLQVSPSSGVQAAQLQPQQELAPCTAAEITLAISKSQQDIPRNRAADGSVGTGGEQDSVARTTQPTENASQGQVPTLPDKFPANSALARFVAAASARRQHTRVDHQHKLELPWRTAPATAQDVPAGRQVTPGKCMYLLWLDGMPGHQHQRPGDGLQRGQQNRTKPGRPGSTRVAAAAASTRLKRQLGAPPATSLPPLPPPSGASKRKHPAIPVRPAAPQAAAGARVGRQTLSAHPSISVEGRTAASNKQQLQPAHQTAALAAQGGHQHVQPQAAAAAPAAPTERCVQRQLMQANDKAWARDQRVTTKWKPKQQYKSIGRDFYQLPGSVKATAKKSRKQRSGV